MKSPPLPEPVTRSQILFYQSEDGSSRIVVRLARDLLELFGCTEWRDFSRAVPKLRNSSIKPGHAVSDHVVTINTMVARGFGSEHGTGGA